MYRDEKLEAYMKGIRDGQDFLIKALMETKGIGKAKLKLAIDAACERATKNLKDKKV